MSMKEHIIHHRYPEWSVDNTDMLICPCGHKVEDDGKCPEGHVSPLKQEGMI